MIIGRGQHKKCECYRMHTFKKLEGTVSDEGIAVLKTDQDRIETNVPIRNE